jgi:Flp pilus assembly protein TadG
MAEVGCRSPPKIATSDGRRDMHLAKLTRILSRPVCSLRALLRARRGSMAPLLALTMPVILLVVVGSIDFSMAVGSKSDLQDAADAASLAVAVATAANPNTPETTLKSMAQTTLATNYKGGTPKITDFHVCAPVQNDCSDNGAAMKSNTVAIGASAPTSCTLASVLPSVCGNGTPTVNARATTVIGFGATMQLNIAMDSSASMIVGATPSDVTLIANWMGFKTVVKGKTTYPNWNAMKPNDPGPSFGSGSGDNPPCSFACHDVSGATSTDIQMGLTNAHTAGATTRYDVMISAAQQLITTLQSEVQNSTTLAKNTYLFNVYSFDTSVHSYGSTNMNFANALSAVSTVKPGLDTYLHSAMSSLSSTIGQNGNGTSSASPLKFMILVTDGLESDRSQNWNPNPTSYDSAWNFTPINYGGFAKPISQADCNAIKNDGVILAVLETPYVPLDGQSPNVKPYEKTVRHVIYPNGPGTTSAVSQALSTCASTGYYFQAASSTDIATGFLTLTNKFVAQSSYISK